MKYDRIECLDFLKGIAIIAVALYHFGGGILPYGYLGVDIFFVVGGFLLIRQLYTRFEKNDFNYWSYIFRKIVRLYPLIILAVVLSMIMGYFVMLPNDYENLAESAVASSLFANNILQCITTKNYWDIVNFYKPLMHMWYVGLLMQAYVILPIVYWIITKLFKDVRKSFFVITAVITFISLVLFVFPTFSTAWKFYYLPFRLFEITGGGLIALNSVKFSDIKKKALSIFSFTVLLFMLCSRWEIGSSNLMLIITVVATIVFVEFSKDIEFTGILKKTIGVLAYVGKRSYSIYIWHQLIIAFLFYSVFSKQSLGSFAIFLVLTVIITLLSYHFIEKRLGDIVQHKKKETFTIIGSITVGIAASVASFLIFINAGVVRNVPELEIKKIDAHRGMHSEYCDRVYSWNRPFNDNNTTKVLVIGNSFGRDWANILYEYDSTLDISFLYYSEQALLDNNDRINQADYVFYALGLSYGSVPNIIKDTVDRQKLYIISNKNYGTSNGIIYAHRGTNGYYSQTVEYNSDLENDIEANQNEWGDHYINMMIPVLAGDNRIRVFTDNNMLISQDCRHLTHAGAQYYARILNIGDIIES